MASLEPIELHETEVDSSRETPRSRRLVPQSPWNNLDSIKKSLLKHNGLLVDLRFHDRRVPRSPPVARAILDQLTRSSSAFRGTLGSLHDPIDSGDLLPVLDQVLLGCQRPCRWQASWTGYSGNRSTFCRKSLKLAKLPLLQCSRPLTDQRNLCRGKRLNAARKFVKHATPVQSCAVQKNRTRFDRKTPVNFRKSPAKTANSRKSEKVEDGNYVFCFCFFLRRTKVQVMANGWFHFGFRSKALQSGISKTRHARHLFRLLRQPG